MWKLWERCEGCVRSQRSLVRMKPIKLPGPLSRSPKPKRVPYTLPSSTRMRQEFAEYHAGKQAKNKKSWHTSGKRNIQITRITGLDSSGRYELGMQDGLKAGMKQPAVYPLDGTRKGRDPTRLEVTLPPQPLAVQYSVA